jgi:hypothetical protein
MSASLPVVDPFERVVREGARTDEEIAGLARDLSNGAEPTPSGSSMSWPARTACVRVFPGRKQRRLGCRA